MYNSQSVDLAICLGNSFEFHNRFFPREALASMSVPKKAGYAASAEMALFWGGNRSIVVTPERIHPSFVEDVSRILGIDVQVDQPDRSTGLVCADLSPRELERIVGSNNGSFVLLPYGVTSQFYQLLDTLEAIGYKPRMRTYPLQDEFWTIDFADSKLGGRTIMNSVSEEVAFFSVPFAIVATEHVTVPKIARSLIMKNRRFLIKSNYGHGGRQVFSFHYGDHGQQFEQLKGWLEAYAVDQFLKLPPYLLEDCVCGNETYSVNANGEVTEAGDVLYEGPAMLMSSPTKKYVGAEIGNGVFQQHLREMLRTIGMAVGKRLADIGYVGWFDVDMIYDRASDRLYGLEINPRATGVTYVIGIAKRLFGENWQQSGGLVSVDRLYLDQPRTDYHTVRDVAHQLTGTTASIGGGVVPVVTGALLADTPYVGYVAFGPDISVARDIRREFEARISNPY